MDAKRFAEILGAEFYAGVPDSQLRALCDYLYDTYGMNPKHHIIAANEGNACAIAAGYYLATGKVPVVYMQNSGEGNIINPCASLLNPKVYAIPVIFIIGWRGEPGVHDEPQHIYQGEVTLKLLETMGIKHFVISKDTTEQEVIDVMKTFRERLNDGEDVAFVIRKGALSYDVNVNYQNEYNKPLNQMLRYQEAGISPWLVAGQANPGNMDSSHAGAAPKGSFTAPTSVQKQAAAVQTLQSINQVVGSVIDTYNYMKYGAPTAAQQLENLQTQGNILGENFRKYAAEADWAQYWNYPAGYGDINMQDSPRAKYMAFSAQEKAAHIAQLESLVETLYPSQAAANEARAALAVYQKEIQEGKYDAILQINTGYPALDNWLKLLAFKLVETNISL